MKNRNAGEMTYLLGKAGDVIKGKGKGDMNTGLRVIIAGGILAGGVIALGGKKIIDTLKKKK